MRINVIKIVKDAGDLNLRDAVKLVDRSPVTVLANCKKGKAEKLVADLKEVGAKVKLVPPTDDSLDQREEESAP